MARTSSIYDPCKCDLDLQPTWKIFQMALLFLKDNNCAISFWNPCINVEVVAWTNPNNARTLTHIHQTKIVTAICLALLQVGSTKN